MLEGGSGGREELQYNPVLEPNYQVSSTPVNKNYKFNEREGRGK